MFSVVMGSGASKGEIPDELNDDAFDDDDVVDREGEDFHKKLENKRRLDALKLQQQKQKSSFFGRKKALEQPQKPPKIVGLEDSDDEDFKAAKAKASADETEIKNGLNELEQTFNSLGLVGKKMWKDESYDDETTRSFATSGRWNKNGVEGGDGGGVAFDGVERQDSAASNEFLTQSYSQHSRFPPRNSISRQHIHGFHGGHGGLGQKKAALKFSWDEDNAQLPTTRETEEWTYKKVRRTIGVAIYNCSFLLEA